MSTTNNPEDQVSAEDPIKRQRGRPLGAKNKPKRGPGRPKGAKTKKKPREIPPLLTDPELELRADQIASGVIEAPAPVVNKGGRPRSSKYLPFAEAREIVRNEMIPSSTKYLSWWDKTQPTTIPRFPYRAYASSWTNWNDFLGTDNQFAPRAGTIWRDFQEATVWANTLGLSTKEDWFVYAKAAEMPPDIPKRPDLVYKQWVGWARFLGKTVAQKIEVARQAQRISIYYIVHHPENPANVFEYGVEPNGISGMHEKWEREKYQLVKAFWYDPEQMQNVEAFVNRNSVPYLDDEYYRITHNVWAIVFQLENTLDVVRT